MGKVCFYTLGPDFTRLLFGFIEEGLFKKVHAILTDGGMPEEMIGDFFKLKYKFEGDSRDENGMSIVLNDSEDNVQEFHFTGVMTAMGRKYEKHQIAKAAKENEDLQVFFKYVPIEYFIKENLTKIMNRYGFKVRESEHGEAFKDGVILQDGTVVQCGYQEHADLYPVLFGLGLANKSQWMDDTMCVHVTAGQVVGNVSHDLRMSLISGDREFISDAQIDALFRYREHVKSAYGEYYTLVDEIREYHVMTAGKGGKYGHLDFMRKYYPNIQLPDFYLEPKSEGVVSIRTSPEMSLPGLLHSVFDIDVTAVPSALQQINEQWEKVKDVREGNKLHVFYQDCLEGLNGVCHYIADRDFSYSVHNERGKIVSGSAGSNILTNEEYKALRKIASAFYHDLNKPVQLEFVVKDGIVYIVQLRILQNNVDHHVRHDVPKDALVIGRSFSRGWIESIPVIDILIVKNECSSEMLLGKKALIVEEDVAFSHILALSKALSIPSIYATGPVDLSRYSKVNFTSVITEGYITQ